MADRTSGRSRSDSSGRDNAGGSPPSPLASASPRTPADQSEIQVAPLTVRIELVVVDGPAAEELLSRQAAVVCEALQWFAEHCRSEYGQESEAPAVDATVDRPSTETPDEDERIA